jgi:predicted outer membrane repeat protein
MTGGSSDHGGGIYCWDACPVIEECIFTSNQAAVSGGAIYCDGLSSPVMRRCTLFGNAAVDTAAGIAAAGSSQVTVENTIIAFGTAGGATYCDGTSGITISCSDVYANEGGGWTGWNWTGCIAGQEAMRGNFSLDPLFCDSGAGNLHLRDCSPCLDASGCGQVGALGPGCPPRVWRIPGDFPTIQAGLEAAAACDTVLVFPGTYQDTVSLPLHVSLLSTGGPDSTVLDAGGSGTVVVIRGDYREIPSGTSSAMLEGFTITGGDGSGIYAEDCAPVIENCIVSANSSGNTSLVGGGIALSWADASITDCIISGNDASSQPDGVAAGGVVCRNSSPTLTHCVISANMLTGCADLGGMGGGGFSSDAGNPVLYDCVISANVCSVSVDFVAGGGAACRYGSLLLANCTVSHNRCFTTYSDFFGGGAIDCYRSGLTLLNCTISDNWVEPGDDWAKGAIYLFSPGDTLDISNTIIAHSSSGRAVYCEESTAPAILATCCNLVGNQGGDWVDCLAGLDSLNGNMSTMPLFCDRVAGDYRLCASSPCLPGNNSCGVLIGAHGEAACACPSCRTITVPGDYPTIGEALSAAQPCDTVLVSAGVYWENLEVTHAVTLVSEDGPESTMIYGEEYSAPVVSMVPGAKAGETKDGLHTILDGFTITGRSAPLVRVEYGTPLIRRCVITDDGISGGAVHSLGAFPVISNCTIAGLYCENDPVILADGGLDTCHVTMENTVIGDVICERVVECLDKGGASLTCCATDDEGDWWGCIAGQGGVNGNFSAWPLFCNEVRGDFRLPPESPCAPGNHPDGHECGLIGALGVGCEGRLWHVPGDVRSIKEAALLALPEDTILVACGTYLEHSIELKDSVMLRSETGLPDCVTIDASSAGRVISGGKGTIIQGVTLTGGYTSTRGGGIYLAYGAPEIVDCRIIGNSASLDGGGVYCYSANAIISGCVVAGNTAQGGAGGIGCEDSDSWIGYSTLYGNLGPDGGGILASGNSLVTVENTIISACRSFTNKPGGVACSAPAAVNLFCSDVYGNENGDWVGCIYGQDGANGNFSADPLFCEPDSGDFRLEPESPCAPANSPDTCGLVGADSVGCEDLSGVVEVEQEVPSRYFLGPSRPNPFDMTTTIRYGLPEAGQVSLRIYDARGRLVRTLRDGGLESAGSRTAAWDGRNNAGSLVTSGVYFYRLTAGPYSKTRRMVFLR